MLFYTYKDFTGCNQFTFVNYKDFTKSDVMVLKVSLNNLLSRWISRIMIIIQSDYPLSKVRFNNSINSENGRSSITSSIELCITEQRWNNDHRSLRIIVLIIVIILRMSTTVVPLKLYQYPVIWQWGCLWRGTSIFGRLFMI